MIFLRSGVRLVVDDRVLFVFCDCLALYNRALMNGMSSTGRCMNYHIKNNILMKCIFIINLVISFFLFVSSYT